MHYKELAEALSSNLGAEISPTSVDAILSKAHHIFGRLGPSRGLWGLRQWLTAPYDFRVDVTALLLDIGELQLVYTILKDKSRPMHANEIAEEISGRYGISAKLLIEANFIDPQDSRLLRLPSGEWGLAEWKKRWCERLDEVDKELKKIEELTKALNEQRFKLSQADFSVNLARNDLENNTRSLLLLTVTVNHVVKKKEQIEERTDALDQNGADLLREKAKTQTNLETCAKVRRQRLVLALCGGAAGLGLGVTQGVVLGGSIGAFSLLLLALAVRAHWRHGTLSRLMPGLRQRSKDVEANIRRLQGEIEAFDRSIRTGCEKLAIARGKLERDNERLVALERQCHDTAARITDLEITAASYDKSGLVTEREALLELLGELPE